MLYKLTAKGDGLGALEPLPFLEVADLQKREKDLENLLASHLLDVLFETQPSADLSGAEPSSRGRRLRPQQSGDLVIFLLRLRVISGAKGETPHSQNELLCVI